MQEDSDKQHQVSLVSTSIVSDIMQHDRDHGGNLYQEADITSLKHLGEMLKHLSAR